MKGENQIESSQEARALYKQQKYLSLQILVFFFFCALLLLERVFYQIVVKDEISILSNFQLSIGLTKIVANKVQPSWIQSGFFTFFNFFSNSKVQFLLLTHVFISAYVSIQTHLVAKVMYMTMAVIFTVSLIQIIYRGARPFWVSDSVLASICQNNFTHPSLGMITMLFVPFYFYYCTKTRQIDTGQSKICKKTILNLIGIFLIAFIVQFINYALGMVFIINIALSTVFLLIFILVITSLNQILNIGLKKLVFDKSKQNFQFKWIFGILFVQAFLLMVYYDSTRFLNIEWIRNYSSCTKYLDYKQETTHYSQTLGTWFTLIQTAPVFGWVSAIFGIRYCNFNMLATEWFQGNTKQKIIRVVIANIFLIPSWMFISFVEPGEWIREAGLNEFIVDSFHYFLLYLWLFGFMPVLVLEKLLHLTPRKYDGQYIMLLERQ